MEEEQIPHMCENISHRPLWSRCPAPTLNYNHDLPKQGTGTADHLVTLFWAAALEGQYQNFCLSVHPFIRLSIHLPIPPLL